MINERHRSTYERGKRHMLASMAAGVTIIWGIPIGATFLGKWDDSLMIWMLLPMIGWLLYFGVGGLLIRCDKCAQSVFIRWGFVSFPWPAKKCDRCDNDMNAEIAR